MQSADRLEAGSGEILRRRDVVAVCILFGGVVAGLVWALSTQARWVQENKPLVIKPPGSAEDETPVQAPATGVIGDINEDTRAAMEKGLAPKKRMPAKPGEKAKPGPKRGERSTQERP